MSDDFDPYLQWLGIRDRQRPPNHYRLLGVELFESDPDVISNAVDRQMAHVRTFQSGPRSAASQRLLNELASAKVCLLIPQKKAVYDTQLRADLAAGSVPAAPGASEAGGAVAPAGPPPIPFRQAQRLALLWVGVSVLVAVGVVVVAILVFVLRGNGPGDEDVLDVASSRGALSAAADKTDADMAPPVASAPKTTGAPKPAGRTAGEPAKAAKPPTEPAKTAGTGARSAAKMEPKPPAEPLPPAAESTEAVRKAMKEPDPAAAKRPVESAEKAAVPKDKEKLDPPPARLPVPDAAAQKAAKNEVREVYRVRFVQAKSPVDKGLLAGELFRQATETKDSPAVRYVLLAEARDLAVAGGDSARLREAVLEMAKGYEVDALQEQTRVLTDAAGSPLPSPVRNSLARAAVGLAQEAIQADAYEAAGQLAEAGFSLASKVMASKGRDLQTIRQAAELVDTIPWCKQQHDLAQAAEKALGQDAGNAKAILFLGKYHTLVKDQWPRGLPLLAKGGDPTLKALAEAELEIGQSSEPTAMVKLADQWMAAVSAVEQPMQRLVRRRAMHWYETALPQLSGFTQSRVARIVQDSKEGEGVRRKP